MKRCPTCQSTYTNDALRFCLQDGTPLVSVSGGSSNPSAYDAEKTLRIEASGSRDEPPPTEILGPTSLPTVPSSKTPATVSQQSRPTEFAAPNLTAQPSTTAPRKSNMLIIPVTVAATVLALALGGLVAWLLWGNKNNSGPDDVRIDGNRTARTTATPGSSPAASPATTASPTPAASAPPVDVAAIRNEVTALLNGWADASMSRDLDAHMSYYADTLDTYYTKTNVSASTVRSDRQRAYETYSSLDIRLSNIEIKPDATGEHATAVFDKTWNFEGDEKSTSGSVQQKLWLARTGGRWRITGEKDLQVYYVNK
ncbi:MAG TPA: nuclear transport factor 2 family protein [Pyrinomonadaceae bacterium]